MSGLPARAMITGANGFIGRALMNKLNALGVHTCGVDLSPDSARHVVAGDIAHNGDWQGQAKGCDMIFHTAAVVSNTASAAQYRAISVAGVRRVIDAAVRYDVPRFLHLSSVAAYGLEFEQTVTEAFPISVLSGYPYCDAKAASEHPVLAAHASGEIAATIVRPGDVYGPGSRPWVMIPLDMLRRRQFLLPASGRGVFSPVYIDNLLEGILAAATQPQASGQIFNITDGVGVQCRDFFSYHQRWVGRSGTPLALPTPLAKGVTSLAEWSLTHVLRQPTEISIASLAMLSRRATYSIEKAQRLLGYQPQIGLEEGMAITEKWLRERQLL